MVKVPLGLGSLKLKFDFEAASRLVPYIKLLERERFRLKYDTRKEYEEFFASEGLARLGMWVAQHGLRCPVIPDYVRLGPCVARPSKIICIGLNYAGHVKETGASMPTEPVVFFKATSALCGPDDDIVIPPGSEKTDWEVELGIVIGRSAKYISEEVAPEHIAGYCLINDVSEREFQIERDARGHLGFGSGVHRC